jgi:hypothetical protein
MPRRNALARQRNGRWHDDAPREDNRKVSTEQMARDLVARGLASKYILSVYRGDHRPDETP